VHGDGDVVQSDVFINHLADSPIKDNFISSLQMRDRYDGFSHVMFRATIPKASTTPEEMNQFFGTLNNTSKLPESDSGSFDTIMVKCKINDDNNNYYLKGSFRLFNPFTWERWNDTH